MGYPCFFNGASKCSLFNDFHFIHLKIFPKKIVLDSHLSNAYKKAQRRSGLKKSSIEDESRYIDIVCRTGFFPDLEAIP